MSSGKNPLVLMMALSMPGAANALGLGDIHVDSGLNERLAAEIDIVGATAARIGRSARRRGESRNLSALRRRPSGVPVLRDVQSHSGQPGPAGARRPFHRIIHRTRGEFSGRPALAQRRTRPPIHFAARSAGTSRAANHAVAIRAAAAAAPAAPLLRCPRRPTSPRHARRRGADRAETKAQTAVAAGSTRRAINPTAAPSAPPARPRISKSAQKPLCAASRGAWANDPSPICRE